MFETMVAAYVIKDEIYSGVGMGRYWYSETKYPQFSPSENIQPEGSTVSITGAEAGDTVYYTTDGTNPYNSSTGRFILNRLPLRWVPAG
jgi:hypothetical protein